MDLLADCLGQFIGGSLNPEVWIAIGATIVAGRTLRQFAFASVCGAILLVIFWSVLARPLLLSVTYPRDLFSVTYPRELNWADVLSYFFLMLCVISFWSGVFKFIISKTIHFWTPVRRTLAVLVIAIVFALLVLRCSFYC